MINFVLVYCVRRFGMSVKYDMDRVCGVYVEYFNRFIGVIV